jgi:ketosteroid isomerase-like protein
MDAATAITHLVYAYAERIDAGDFEGIADLLAHADVTSNQQAKVRRGRDEILAMYTGSTRSFDDGTPKTKHVTTNLIVDGDDGAGTGTCRSYFTVFQAVPGELALQPVIAGRYHDRFERVDGKWRFAARHILVDLVGDLSRHLLLDMG